MMKKGAVMRQTSASDKPTTTSTATTVTAVSHPLEKTRDSANIPSSHGRKNSRDDKGALTKTPLSKSHDNLASILRKKAAAATLAGNKENIKDRVLSPAPSTFKVPKSGTPMRKTQSAHNIDDSSTPMKRAQSAQNISKSTSATAGAGGSVLHRDRAKINAVKRANSTQNVNKANVRQRISAPGNAMSHNAELLATFEKERRNFEAKISELIQASESRKAELEKAKFRLNRLEDENRELRHDNRLYKDKLHELGVAVMEYPADSADGMLATTSRGGATGVDAHAASSLHRGISGGTGEVGSDGGQVGSERAPSVGDMVSCLTPEHPSCLSFDNWETKSNKSSDATSEISLACLQDRISQMEETHYSTNEELEATRLELADLQDTVNELTHENEQLADDKDVLLESLCAQTEKLENCRMQIEHLKALLVGDAELAGWPEKEKQLVELIKSAQLEKDELLLREKELANRLVHAENSAREQQDVITALRDAAHIQTMKLESLAADKKALETQLSEMKEQMAKEQIELTRYRTLLENEKQKVTELEQERNATDKSDLEDLLDNTRMEKERLEEKLANTQEDLAVSKNEVAKLKDMVSSLEQDVIVCKNNAKTEVSNLHYQIENLVAEKQELQQEVETLQEHIDQLQQDCDRYLEENQNYLTERTSLETQLKMLQAKERELDKKIKEEQQRFVQEREDWQQFQMDLQLAVKVASDFKSEAQEDMERVIAERHFYHSRTEALQDEVSRLQEELERYKSLQQRNESDMLKRNELRGKMISTMGWELAALRSGQKLSSDCQHLVSGKESTSVKNLIAAIEKQVKGDRGTPPLSPSVTSQDSSSRRNSMDSTMSIGSAKSDTNTTSPKIMIDRRTSAPVDSPYKTQSRHATATDARSPISHRHTIGNIMMDKEQKQQVPLAAGGGGKETEGGKKLTGILSHKSALRKSSLGDAESKDKPLYHSGVQGLKTDPLAILAKQMGGSKRNALLKWCQNRLATYPGIDITNFSSSWNDGLAFCALIHSYRPNKIPYGELNSADKLRNFTLAFNAAKSEGIPSHLNISDMVAIERPDWQAVMAYVTSIYKHFELDQKS